MTTSSTDHRSTVLVLADLAGEPKHGYAIAQDVAETIGMRLSAGPCTR